MTINDENKNSFINQIQDEKEDLSKISPPTSSKYYKIPKSIVILCSIVFSIMVLVIIGLSLKQISISKYSPVMDIEELILIKDFERAEELSYKIYIRVIHFPAIMKGPCLGLLENMQQGKITKNLKLF